MQASNLLSRWSVCAVLAVSAPFAAAQTLTKVERPAGVTKQMTERGQQDQALPTIKIVSPKPNEVINGNARKTAERGDSLFHTFDPGAQCKLNV